CVNTNNTASCNDSNACTTSDTCSGGACVGGSPPNCDDSNLCTNDSCNPGSGCVNTNNTASCNDSDACTTSDTCSGGACVGGSPLNCDDSNVCTNDSCNPGTGCVNTNNTASCEDGLFCNGAETCDGAGACVAGPAETCADADICTDDSCNVGTDQCANIFDEGNDPTCVIPVCGNNAVESGEQCDDNNTVNGDCCSSTCQFEGSGSSCADGMFCNGAETCDGAGTCDAGTSIDCDDADLCTDDSCNEASDQCNNIFDVTNDPICLEREVTIEGILAFFDDACDQGTLVGRGPGKSADGRKNALRKMLETAETLINNESPNDACHQLLSALHRTDGGRDPKKDFVEGEAAPTLADMIFDLWLSMDCNEKKLSLSLGVTKRIKLEKVKPVDVSVKVKNSADIACSMDVNVVGVQNWTEVYNETRLFDDPMGNANMKMDFPSYTPVVPGDILWSATTGDGDGDDQEETALTEVMNGNGT
ncbi:MAG: hypothetical protein Q8R92_14235, partial [Deltaproteobacteria bacterium]|nr:hypothetical protein [Deltaproteobacteria bacterium]